MARRVSTRQRFPFLNTFLTRPITITNNNTSPSSAPEGKRRLSLFSHFEAILQNSCRNARHLLQIQALLVTSSLFRNPFLARTILNLACYQFLLIIYAVSAQRENVSGVQKLMKERRLGIIPGSNLVDLKHIVHNFQVTDKGQEGIEVVDLMMDELAHRFRLPSSDLGQKQSTS